LSYRVDKIVAIDIQQVQPRYIRIGIGDGSLDTACVMDGGERRVETGCSISFLLGFQHGHMPLELQ